MERKSSDLGNVATVVIVIIVSAVHWGLSRIAISFQDLFRELGFETQAALPALSSLMLSGPRVFLVVPSLVFSLVILNRMRVGDVSKSAVIVGASVLTLGSVVVFGIAMFLPSRQLGAVVQ